MKTLTLNIKANCFIHKNVTPSTARGRALYTTSWFLNGKPHLCSYDNKLINLHHACTVTQ